MKENRSTVTALLLYVFISLPASAQITFATADDAVHYAMQHEYAKITERALVLENMKKAGLSIKDFLPSLDMSLSESASVSTDATDSRTKTIQFSLTQRIFDGGLKKLSYDMANIEALYAFRENSRSLQSYYADILADYYECLVADLQYSIKTQLAENAKTELDIMKSQFDLGMVLETDYLEYLISFMDIENTRDSAARTFRIKKRKLKLAIGLPEATDIVFTEKLQTQTVQTCLEPYMDPLWAIVRSANLELQKQDLSLQFSRKQEELNNKWYLPVISIQPGVSFSGESYPLSDPRYSIRLSFSFENNPFFPLSISDSYTTHNGKLTGVSNSADTSLPESTTVFTDRRMARLTIMQSVIKRQDTEKKLYADLYEQVINHDDYIRSIGILQKTIGLQERRLDFSRFEVDKGSMKRIDFLKQMMELAEKKSTLIQTITAVLAVERSLEILTQIPFGELVHACQ